MLRKWRARHRNPTNLVLHAAGIPATVLAIPAAWMGQWLFAVGLFAGGYAVQLLGHIIEGNRSGEEEVIRKLLARARRS